MESDSKGFTAGSDRAPLPPRWATAVFGENLPVAQAYAEWLAGPGTERGLLGPREVPRLWDRHLGNCAAVAALVPPAASVIDVGSGAGLPGVVLAIVRPDIRVVLVEPMQRRTAFLQETARALGLGNVDVRRGRAEELHGRLHAQVVTARAVAPLDRLASWCLPLLEPGGTLLAVKGSTAADELVGAAPTLRRLGAVDWAVEVVGVDILEVPATVVRVEVGQSGQAGPGRRQGRRPGGRRGRGRGPR